MSNISCRDLTVQINEIKNLREQMGFCIKNREGKQGKQIQATLEFKILEIQNAFPWRCETITLKEIERQYDHWAEVYQFLGYDKLPSKQRVIEFFQDSPELAQLMLKKEQQGFTKLILAPAPGFYPLQGLEQKVTNKVKRLGGMVSRRNHIWNKMLDNEKDIKYFGSIRESDSIPREGIEPATIKQNPEAFSICDGFIVGFAESQHKITSPLNPKKK